MQLTDHPELVAKICYFLGLIYRNVKWSRMAHSKGSAYDIFEHRLEVATYNDSIPAFLKKLCNGLSLQAPSIPPLLIDELDRQGELALEMMRSWPQYFVYRASFVSKQLKENKTQLEIIKIIIEEIKGGMKKE